MITDFDYYYLSSLRNKMKIAMMATKAMTIPIMSGRSDVPLAVRFLSPCALV